MDEVVIVIVVVVRVVAMGVEFFVVGVVRIEAVEVVEVILDICVVSFIVVDSKQKFIKILMMDQKLEKFIFPILIINLKLFVPGHD